MPVLLAEQVTRHYGDVPGIVAASLTVDRGEVISLVGPNGAGKTTLLQMCGGIMPPTAGRLEVLGFRWGDGSAGNGAPPSLPAELWRMRRRLGFVPAAHEVVESLTAREYLRFAAAVHQLPRADAERSIDRWLDFFGLAAAADRLLGSYSHGMKKKVQLAGALLSRPQLFICDEPTSGLDPEMVALVRQLLTVLQEHGVAVLIATHDLAFAERISQRVYVVYGARILAGGSVEELTARYGGSGLEEAFLAAIGANQRGDRLRELVAG